MPYSKQFVLWAPSDGALTSLLQLGGHLIGHLLGEVGGGRGIGEGHTWDHRSHTRGVQWHGRGYCLQWEEQKDH